MAKCITFRTNVYMWLMKAGMTMHEVLVYCTICDYIRNNQAPRFTYKQIAEMLGSEDKAKSPNAARRVIKSLAEKGFIEINYHGGMGSANHYRLLKTPFELFQMIDESDPDFFSDAQREQYIEELKLNCNCTSKHPEKSVTKKVEKKQAKSTVPTVDANNWENREEDLRAKANYLWKTKYKDMVGKRVSIAALRDELRGSEADCKQTRPDKYWTLGKFDFNFIQTLKEKGVNVVANGYDVFKGEPFIQGDSFENLKVTHYIDDNGKYRQDLEFIEKVVDVVPDLM